MEVKIMVIIDHLEQLKILIKMETKHIILSNNLIEI